MILKIENVPKGTPKSEVKKLFRVYGKVTDVIQKKAAAFICMPSNRRARIAKANLNGMKWKGNYVEISEIENAASSSVCRTQLGMIKMF